ncbi:hypothetical protein SFA35_08980 [Pseudomonas sp. HR96]|uniref:hypothetical protein n=1 Tax=Pseudomonas sp. HR96 TaxID=1027966 RepID=UPI002A74DE46|nr:hypothetical protein [Pseudomonas sp. HR96]WPP02348.1 hypothetical protein SFA35_08980 [Pseudomonas sp. HR96]
MPDLNHSPRLIGANCATHVAGAHAHSITTNSSGDHHHSVTVGAVGDHVHGIAVSDADDHTHSISVAESGGAGARPRNVALLYVIKY